MATKKITDLQIRSDFDDTCNLPVDDASQTWRVTGAQVKAWIEGFLGTRAVPTGTVLAFMGTAAPEGFFLCDGGEKSETTFAALKTVIGTAFNTAVDPLTGSAQSAPSAGNFRIPNLKGVFLRGVADYVGSDSYSTDNDVVLGAYRVDRGQGHLHSGDNTITYTYANPGGGGVGMGTGVENTGVPVTDGTNGTPRVGKETSPKQVGVNYIIKY